MKYMLDAMLYGWAKELREHGIDIETATRLIRGHDDSSITIDDPIIVDYLRKSREDITLITNDDELAQYCKVLGLRYLRVLDAVIHYIKHQQ